jgi:hypothetical protein
MMHLANHLDNQGLVKEANYLDAVLRKNASPEEGLKKEEESEAADQEAQASTELISAVAKLACHLDERGLVREANYLDA